MAAAALAAAALINDEYVKYGRKQLCFDRDEAVFVDYVNGNRVV